MAKFIWIPRITGSPEDYNNPIAEGNLWKLTPKDPAKPTLYYSQKNKRVMKMNVAVNGMGGCERIRVLR